MTTTEYRFKKPEGSTIWNDPDQRAQRVAVLMAKAGSKYTKRAFDLWDRLRARRSK